MGLGECAQRPAAWGGRKNLVPELLKSVFQNDSVLDSGLGHVGCLAVLGHGSICRGTADLHGC